MSSLLGITGVSSGSGVIKARADVGRLEIDNADTRPGQLELESQDKRSHRGFGGIYAQP